MGIDADNITRFVKGARARWKIENETYNTLKDQGYNLSHNYGHGNNNLTTVLCYTMFIAFTIDQVQFAVGYYIKRLLELLKFKNRLWKKTRNFFFYYKFSKWKDLYQKLIDRLSIRKGFKLSIDTM